jgi:hypothetical protein
MWIILFITKEIYHYLFDKFFAFLRSKNYSDTIKVESTSMRKDGSIEIEKLNRSLDCIYGKLEGRLQN